MTKHTPGPLHLSRTRRWRMKAFDEVGNMVVSTDYSQHSTAQAIADIGRVVACWNACAGYADPEDMRADANLMHLMRTEQFAMRHDCGDWVLKRRHSAIFETVVPGTRMQIAPDGGWIWTAEARAAVDVLRGEHA